MTSENHPTHSMTVPGHVEVRDGNLAIAGHDCVDLAEEFGTPLYVTSADRVRENYRRIRDAVEAEYGGGVRVHYACKANTNLSVLRILEKEGGHIDAVSLGEVESALRAGFSPDRILYTGTAVSTEEMEGVVARGATVNVDSMDGLERLAEAGGEGFSVRINPEVGAGHHDHCITGGPDSKFGVWEDDAVEAYKTGKELGLEPVGIHMHIGSGILDADRFVPAVEKMMEVAGRVADEADVEFEFIDIGGGVGIPYRPGETPLDVEDFAEKVVTAFDDGLEEHSLGKPALAMEPGRYLVADTTLLLTRVSTVKETPFHTFAGVDAGFNTLLRPAMYGSYHHVFNASNPDGEVGEYGVAGPVCESGDLLARDREIPEIRRGDTLAVRDAGAYGFAMASRYNSRPLPAEVLIAGEPRLMRERESLDDLFERQV